MFIEVEYRGEILKIDVYSLDTSFDVSDDGSVLYFVCGRDENDCFQIVFSSPDVLEAWRVYKKYKVFCMLDEAQEE